MWWLNLINERRQHFDSKCALPLPRGCDFRQFVLPIIYIYMIKCCVWKPTICKCTYWKMVPCQPEIRVLTGRLAIPRRRPRWQGVVGRTCVREPWLKSWSFEAHHLVIWLFSRRIHATYIFIIIIIIIIVIIIIIIIINQKLSKYTHDIDPFASGICVTCSLEVSCKLLLVDLLACAFCKVASGKRSCQFVSNLHSHSCGIPAHLVYNIRAQNGHIYLSIFHYISCLLTHYQITNFSHAQLLLVLNIWCLKALCRSQNDSERVCVCVCNLFVYFTDMIGHV